MRKSIISICMIFILLITGCNSVKLAEDTANLIDDDEIEKTMVEYLKNSTKAFNERSQNNGMVLTNDEMKKQYYILNSYVKAQFAQAEKTDGKQKELHLNRAKIVSEFMKIGYLIAKIYLETEAVHKLDVNTGESTVTYFPDETKIKEIKDQIDFVNNVFIE